MEMIRGTFYIPPPPHMNRIPEWLSTKVSSAQYHLLNIALTGQELAGSSDLDSCALPTRLWAGKTFKSARQWYDGLNDFTALSDLY